MIGQFGFKVSGGYPNDRDPLKGFWDADKNDPDLLAKTPDDLFAGDFWIVNEAGNTVLNPGGATDWEVGDSAQWNGAQWVRKLDRGDIDTLAELNAIITDATLDDINDPRDPKPHAETHVDGTDDIQDATPVQKGLMTPAYALKLDGIEAGATSDLDGAEIKLLYEANFNTNAFTDDEKSKLASLTGDLNLVGAWDASANTPTLADGVGTSGDAYLVTVSGTQDLGSGAISYTVGDRVAYDGAVWYLVPASTAFQIASEVALDGPISGLTATEVYSALVEVTGFTNTLLADSHTHTNKATLDAITAAFTTTLQTKLNGIEAGATADQNSSEVELSASIGSYTATDVHEMLTQLATNLVAVLGAVEYIGTWNANTNTPNLSALTPEKGDYYIISVAGSTPLGGVSDWAAGDWAVYNGASWQKVDNTDSFNAALLSNLNAAYNHISDTTNPHNVTKSQVGLGNVANVNAIPYSEKGAANGVATLDGSGKITTSQLPGAIDEIEEYANLASFPGAGSDNILYLDLSTNKIYRWSGTVYVEISASLALGETSSTAYRGDRGKAAYDHSQLSSGNPHNVTAADVGLGNVANVNAIPYSEKGAVNGVAELGGDGKVLASQLPAAVDEILEYANLASFPGAGASNFIYLALDTGKIYRWSGTVYVEISASLALGETSSTAYRGDRGKTAYDHTLLTNNPHSVTAAQIGVEAGATADQTPAEIEAGYNSQVPQVTAPEKTAGTETAIRRFSPKDVADMAGTHGGGGGSSFSTLAELNTLVSDATLDDSSDPRDPNAHTHSGADITTGTVGKDRLPDAVRKQSMVVRLFADGDTWATGNGVERAPVPGEVAGLAITDVELVSESPASSLTQLQVHNVTAVLDILSTVVSIDSGERTSTTAATPAVVNTSNNTPSVHDILRFDLNAGAGTGALWAIVVFE